MEQTRISSSQGTQPAHAARTKPATPAAEAGDAAGAGGFLALLAALGDGPLTMDEASVGLADAGTDTKALLASEDGKETASAFSGLLPDAGKESADAAALAAWQGLLVPSASARPTGDSATLAAQNAAFGANGGANALAGALAGPGGSPQGLVAETAMLDASTDLKGGAQPAGAPGFARAFSRMQGNALAQKADALDGIGSRGAAAEGSKQLLAQQAFTPTVGGSFQAVAERATGGVGAERTGSRADVVPGSEPGAVAAEGLVAAAASARGGESAGARQGDGAPGAASWSDGLSAGASQEAGPIEGTVFTDPAQLAAEEQIADQVSYWVHQKTQNAELTLDRDGQPVEVSVTLTGNEAHVSFRSDQAHTRDMLDRSMAQLSELLRSEGLVLSGMSVGTSAGQGAGPGDQQRQRDGSRQAQVVSSAPAGSTSLQRSGASPDRAVDIFV